MQCQRLASLNAIGCAMARQPGGQVGCNHAPGRSLSQAGLGKRSAQACRMEARRAETQASPRLGSRQPFPAGARNGASVGCEAEQQGDVEKILWV